MKYCTLMKSVGTLVFILTNSIAPEKLETNNKESYYHLPRHTMLQDTKTTTSKRNHPTTYLVVIKERFPSQAKLISQSTFFPSFPHFKWKLGKNTT